MVGEGIKWSRVRRAVPVLAAATLVWVCVVPALAVDRFPRPEFNTPYVMPTTTTPAPRPLWLESLDVGVLFAALCMASYLALSARSRRGMLLLSVFCLLYFGFWRKGCVCPVGAVQNVALALSDRTYLIPASVLLFFLLPLFFALFFGRTFCAAVCPLGAVQDVVVLRPVRVPPWISGILGIMPHIYLGLAVLFVAAGGGFVVCRYDPFVGFFRLGASFAMLSFGVLLLALGVFVARPYCRFLCPYGVLLGWCSRLARRHVTITPTDCVSCRLCEESCPFDAIMKPTPEKVPETRKSGVKLLALLLALLPVVMVAAGAGGYLLHIPFARSVIGVSIAEQVVTENRLGLEPRTLESKSFRLTGKPLAQLVDESRAIQRRFRIGGIFFGAFVGLIIDLKLIGLTLRRRRTGYSIDPETCVSCARCFMSCPKERERLKTPDGLT